jgi:acyl-CoA synthetase (NDP forming)
LHDKCGVAGHITSLSATEIINELPKLTETELRSVRQRLLELAAHNQEIDLCDQAAQDGAVMFDRMEEEDARHQGR